MEEGWDSDNHLEDQDTQSPPVNCKVMPVSNQHLWRQVFGSAAERVGELALLHKFGEAKVSD